MLSNFRRESVQLMLNYYIYDGRTFTASAVAPGGISVSGDKITVTWAEPGMIAYSWIQLYDLAYNSLYDVYTNTSPHIITFAYVPGGYRLFVMQEKYVSAFTGSGIDTANSYFHLYEKIRDEFTK